MIMNLKCIILFIYNLMKILVLFCWGFFVVVFFLLKWGRSKFINNKFVNLVFLLWYYFFFNWCIFVVMNFFFILFRLIKSIFILKINKDRMKINLNYFVWIIFWFFMILMIIKFELYGSFFVFCCYF